MIIILGNMEAPEKWQPRLTSCFHITFAHPPLVVVYGASGTLEGPMVGEDHETETFVVRPLVSGYKPWQVTNMPCKQNLSLEFYWRKGREWGKGREREEKKKNRERPRERKEEEARKVLPALQKGNRTEIGSGQSLSVNHVC